MKEKGQSLIELALSLVVLLFLLGGLVEFGMIFFQFVQLRDAAQEGALYGSMGVNASEIESRARNSSNTPINLQDPAKVSIRISVADTDGNPKDASLACEGDALKVELFFNHHIFMPFVPQILGRSDITLHAEVIDTVLAPRCK